MQLVQEGKIRLDDPVSKYGITLESDGIIRVKHLLTHTSQGNPGEGYSYNGNRFAELDKVVQKASGKSFAELLIEKILDPLGMNETAPNVPKMMATKSPPGADKPVEDEVQTTVRNIVAGFNSGNLDEIERYVAPQANSYSGPGGFLIQFLNPEELRDSFRSGLKLNLELYNLEVAVYGATALATFIQSVNLTPPNGTPRTEGPWRTSLVFNKQDGVWKVIHAHQSALNRALIKEKQQQRFDTISKTLAQPYGLDRQFKVTRISYPQGFSTSAGLIASVLDMAKYDIAIDQNKFLTKDTQQLAFTPFVSTKGEKLPYGLGWFTQDYQGTKLVWHYGYWTANSSFILKVPERNITFIAMANTDNLSRPTDLGAGNALSSPVGVAFLKTFIFPQKFGEVLPEINWKAPAPELKDQLKQLTAKPYGELYIKELVTKARIYQSVGESAESTRLMKVYGELYSKPLPESLTRLTVIAEISQVVDDENKTVAFNLPSSQEVRIFAVGEAEPGQMYDYGWIEDEKGVPVWEMKEPATTHAGGAEKNRKVDVVINLPAGNYRLRYKSDDSHSFDRWNALPPENNFWGVAVYRNSQ
jgi:CubicO group peptidase (beta-lactamase class C family)